MSVPYYIMCGIGILEAFIATLLPETVGSALPQTFKEANEVGKNQRFFSVIHRWNAHKYYNVKKKTKEEQISLSKKADNTMQNLKITKK